MQGLSITVSFECLSCLLVVLVALFLPFLAHCIMFSLRPVLDDHSPNSCLGNCPSDDPYSCPSLYLKMSTDCITYVTRSDMAAVRVI